MISYERFGSLRLSHYLPEADIVRFDQWKFDDRMWAGEAIGFSEWLRPEDDPETLQSLAIDFKKFPADTAERVLRDIELPVSPAMTFEQLRATLGEPAEVSRYVRGQADYEFISPEPYPYRISCTVADDGGLVYLVVLVRQVDEAG
jgi:hypothetical protein